MFKYDNNCVGGEMGSGVKPDYIFGIHCFSVKHQHYRVRADIAEKLLTWHY